VSKATPPKRTKAKPAPATPKRKMGRPSLFRPEFSAQAAKLCALGATNPDLADFFGVADATIDKWIADIPEFSGAVKGAKEALDAKVERRLFERAMGYEHPEIDIRVVGRKLVKTPIRKVYAPDTTAAIFWLKNRQSAHWRDIKAVELTGAQGGPLRITSVELVHVEPEQKDEKPC
jgi:hypothetical protein